ncbi:MAG: sigma-70 factor domain-containing protein, partial [Microcoleus sp.]
MKTLKSSDTDSVRAYLREIGRVPLLTHEQEILYGKQVQRSTTLNLEKNILAEELGRDPTVA